MKRLLLAVAAIIAMTASGAAAARVDVDISIGGPDILLGGPDVILGGPDVILGEPDIIVGRRDYYYPPVRYVRRPRVVILPERIYRPAPVYHSRFHRDDYRWRPDYPRYRPYSPPGHSQFNRGWVR